MKDVVNAFEDGTNGGVEVIVGVRDDADFHREGDRSCAALCAAVSSGCSSGSDCVSAPSFSAGDSTSAGPSASMNFIAPANNPVKSPPLNRVLRKNSHTCGQPEMPVVNARSQST